MEEFKIGYVPNLSQRIQEYTERQATLLAAGQPGMDILPFSLGMDVNSVFFTARLQSHSWFRMEFGFIDEVTFSNGARYRYIGLHVPELYSYYSGNYSAVYSHASFYPVIQDANFYLDALANLPKYDNSLVFGPLYTPADSARQLDLDYGYDPIEI